MQVQCPNCHGYKTHKIGSYFIDPITHQRLGLNTPLGCLIPIVIVPVGWILIGAIILTAIPGTPSSSVYTSAIEGGLMIALALALIVWIAARKRRRAELKRTAILITHYECSICGKKFIA